MMGPVPQLKVVVLGDPLTGKSSLCHLLEDPTRLLRQEWPQNVEYFHFEANVDRPLRMSSSSSQRDASDVTINRVRIQLVDQSGVDRYSLQPIVFRKAVGVIITIDAPMLYREYMSDNASRFHFSTQQTPCGSTVSLATNSAPFTPSSSRYMSQTPAAGAGWDLYLKELILMWRTIVTEESQFARENRSQGISLPCFVFFTKCDLLPVEEEEQSVTAFRSECRMVCLRPDLKIDFVHFVGLADAPSEVMFDAQKQIVSMVLDRVGQSKSAPLVLLGIRSSQSKRQQPIVLGGNTAAQPVAAARQQGTSESGNGGTPSGDTNKRKKRPCCGD